MFFKVREVCQLLSLWKSAGKPNAGALYETTKQAKNQFKYAVRRLKRAGDSIQNDKFVTSIVLGGVNVFKEIKKFYIVTESWHNSL